MGFAGKKFSGSINRNGNWMFTIMNKNRNNIRLTKSFTVK